MNIQVFNLNRAIERVKTCKSADSIIKYDRYNSVRGLKDSRRHKLLNKLYILATLINKELNELNKDDLFELIETIKKRKIKPVTIEDFKMVLRGYLKYYKKKKLLAILKVNHKIYSGGNTLPEEIITEPEINKVLDYETKPMYRALLMSLYESGARRSEFLPLKIKNVNFDNDGCSITLAEGKTGQRRVRLVNSTSLIAQWLSMHPQKDNKEAYLWLNKYENMLREGGATKELKKTFKKANINKPCNLHHFRHSRATFMANHLTEAQMNIYFGWTQDSRMASKYVHLSGRDVDNSILNIYNRGSKQETKSQLQPIKCFNCKGLNEAGRTRCNHCGLPLDYNGLREQIKKDMIIDELIKQTNNIQEITKKYL